MEITETRKPLVFPLVFLKACFHMFPRKTKHRSLRKPSSGTPELASRQARLLLKALQRVFPAPKRRWPWAAPCLRPCMRLLITRRPLRLHQKARLTRDQLAVTPSPEVALDAGPARRNAFTRRRSLGDVCLFDCKSLNVFLRDL